MSRLLFLYKIIQIFAYIKKKLYLCSAKVCEMNQVAQKIADIWHSNQIVRYAVCGGGNMVFDWVLYFLLYNFVIGHEIVHWSLVIGHWSFTQAITPHIATLCIVFPITLLTGFALQKYVTFRGERTNGYRRKLHGWRQLMRYILIVAVNLTVNYLGLKLCVESFGWYPTPSKMAITIVTVIISYLGQKYYTFRSKEVKE